MTDEQFDQLRQTEREAWLDWLTAPLDPDKDKAWKEASRALIDGITGTYPVVQFTRLPDEGLL